MDIFRKYFIVIVLSIIIVIVWGGIILFSDRSYSTINPNAEKYTKPLSSKFDEEVLTAVDTRTKSSFPILPSVFFELTPEAD